MFCPEKRRGFFKGGSRGKELSAGTKDCSKYMRGISVLSIANLNRGGGKWKARRRDSSSGRAAQVHVLLSLVPSSKGGSGTWKGFLEEQPI